jgi:hypothetical protein
MTKSKSVIIWLLCLCIIGGKAASQAIEISQSLYPYLLTWNKDGDKLAVTTHNSVGVYDTNFKLIGVFSSENPEQFLATAWSPDGARIAVGNIILDSETLKPLITLNTEARPFQWSFDGQLLMTFALDYKGIERYDSETGKLVDTLSTSDVQMASEPILSPDGTRFLSKDGCCGVLIVDAVNGGAIARWNLEHPLYGLTWSSDGNQIAYSSIQRIVGNPSTTFPPDTTKDQIMSAIHILDSQDGRVLQSFDPFPYDAGYLYWSPSGNEIVSISTGVVTWDIETGQIIDAYLPDKRVQSATFSPNGGRLALALWPYIDSLPESITAFRAMSTVKQSYLDGSIEIISPGASIEKLASIQAQCAGNTENSTMSLDIPKTKSELTAYTARLAALSDTQIPPGCKADLLAVANALLAQTK